MSQKYTLRAMVNNYRNGHSWDHLDGDVVTKAADEIESLQRQLDESIKLLSQAQQVIRIFQGRM